MKAIITGAVDRGFSLAQIVKDLDAEAVVAAYERNVGGGAAVAYASGEGLNWDIHACVYESVNPDVTIIDNSGGYYLASSEDHQYGLMHIPMLASGTLSTDKNDRTLVDFDAIEPDERARCEAIMSALIGLHSGNKPQNGPKLR